jgi:molecular chaperone DnaJ
MSTKRDLYEILGVGRDVGDEELKKAYRTLAMKYHPDRNAGDEEAAVRFKEAAEAYDVLHDPEKRQLYDRYGHAGLNGARMPNFTNVESVFDAFGDLLNGFFGGGGRRGGGPQPGDNLLFELEIDLFTAARGGKRTITVGRRENCHECSGSGCKRGSRPATCRQCRGQGVVLLTQGFFRIQQTCRGCGGQGVVITDPCTNCHGRGRVKAQRTLDINVPAGAYHGLRLVLRGEGEAGGPGAERGNLFVELHVREHPLFKRDGDHLICHVPVTFSQAALGGDIDVPTLEGAMTHTLKPGLQSGEFVRIHGKGMPNLRSGRHGDLIVVIQVETPRHLTTRQEELLRELAEIDKKHVSPQRKSFFEKLRDLFTSSEKNKKDQEPGSDRHA